MRIVGLVTPYIFIIIYATFALAATLLLGAIIYTMPLCSIRKIRCSLDPVLSSYAHNHVKDFFSHTLSAQPLTTHDITTLRNNLPWVRDITFSVSPKQGYLTLIPYRPYAYVNSTMILSHEGVVMEQLLFNKNKITDLPTITVERTLENREKVMSEFLINLPQEIFIFYHCHWFNDKTIIFHDKHNSLSIKSCVDNPPTSEILRACLYLKGSLARNGSLKHGWVIDARFKGLLILGKKGE